MSEETLKIVVPVFTAVLGLFVGYFLNKALYERKRRDDLADKEHERRTERMDKRLEESNSYIDNLVEVSKSVWTQGNRLIHNGSLNDYETRHERNHEMMDSIALKAPNLFLLEDSQMQDLNNKMVSLIEDAWTKNISLARTMKKRGATNKDESRNSLSELNEVSARLYKAMKRRLDELSQENFIKQ